MATGKQDIIRAAIQLEHDGHKFYLEAAAKTSNALARKMFESLADDEVRHIEWLEQLAPEEKTGEAVNKELYRRLSNIFADAPESMRRAAKVAQDDIDVIKLGVAMEAKSREAYLKWAEASEIEEVRSLCDVLAEAERFHRELLENTIEYLEHSIDWFLQDRGVVELG